MNEKCQGVFQSPYLTSLHIPDRKNIPYFQKNNTIDTFTRRYRPTREVGFSGNVVKIGQKLIDSIPEDILCKIEGIPFIRTKYSSAIGDVPALITKDINETREIYRYYPLKTKRKGKNLAEMTLINGGRFNSY